MEITGKNLTATMEAYAGKIQQAKQPAPTDSEKEHTAVKGDTVNLSREAKEVAAIRQKLEDIPDIRDGKVAEIKEKIDAGTYDVNGQKAASNMLTESLINQIV